MRDIVLQSLYNGFPPLTAYPQSQRQRIENERKELRLREADMKPAALVRA